MQPTKTKLAATNPILTIVLRRLLVGQRAANTFCLAGYVAAIVVLIALTPAYLVEVVLVIPGSVKCWWTARQAATFGHGPLL